MVYPRDKEKVMTLREVYAKCAPKPLDYPGSLHEYMRECADALEEITTHKYDFVPRRATIGIPKVTPPSNGTGIAFVQKTIDSAIPYVLLMLVAIIVAVALYFPAAVALMFIAGAYASKLALDLNRKLRIVNHAYIKAALIACSGLALETIVLLLARLF